MTDQKNNINPDDKAKGKDEVREQAQSKSELQPQTSNIEPKTENMEMHKHPHHVTHTKKWPEYLLEFLMLFLAVFLGFLAENQREHLVEHRREKKLIETLYADLKRDTADFINDTTWWDGAIKRIDTIRMEILNPTNERNISLLYRKVAGMRSNNSFQYHDRTIQQLKNGGNFRLIRNKTIADSLIEYDALILTGLKDQEAIANGIYQQVNFMQDKIFNSKYFDLRSNQQMVQLDSVIRTDPEIFDLSSASSADLIQYYNSLEFYQRTMIYRVATMKFLSLKAIRLIGLLEKEYHLK